MSEPERKAQRPADPPARGPSAAPPPAWSRWLVRSALWLVGLVAAGALSVVVLVGIALAVAYPNLPEISGLMDYRPKLPMRIFSVDDVLLGEYGEERRTFTPLAQIPKVMQQAVLASEDARFYEHSGVDIRGVLRAGLAQFNRSRSQGASTITMQVARNFYLSTEKTYTRKIYEMLLAFKMESVLSKDQILEVYMNQIFLGQRAYGFASASEIYFGKPLRDISVAEAAMLAGLPQAPSLFNPISNPKRAKDGQLRILDRMLDNGFITAVQRDSARVDGRERPVPALETLAGQSERSCKRHAVDVAGRAGLRCVDVRVSVDPEHAPRPVHGSEPSERPERDRVVAAEHERERAALRCFRNAARHELAGVVDLGQEPRPLVT